MKNQKERDRIAKNMEIKPGKIYTGQEAADMIGVSYQHLLRLIHDKKFPTLSKKFKWIKVGGYQIIDYLLQE